MWMLVLQGPPVGAEGVPRVHRGGTPLGHYNCRSTPKTCMGPLPPPPPRARHPCQRPCTRDTLCGCDYCKFHRWGPPLRAYQGCTRRNAFRALRSSEVQNRCALCGVRSVVCGGVWCSLFGVQYAVCVGVWYGVRWSAAYGVRVQGFACDVRCAIGMRCAMCSAWWRCLWYVASGA
jgi:hypothetical protein